VNTLTHTGFPDAQARNSPLIRNIYCSLGDSSRAAQVREPMISAAISNLTYISLVALKLHRFDV
jgi:hypothetical protein